jgi:hypothetical protein
VRRKKKLKQIKGTLYGVSIIKLPSGETQGSVPCWKKVTYINGIKPKIVVNGFKYRKRSPEKSCIILTWSGSKPKYRRLSKNLRVASSVKGLVIIYQWICTALPGAAKSEQFEHEKLSKEQNE